jgi:hypothetical protein
VKEWADKTAGAFRQWADEIMLGKIQKHSLFVTPRIECTLHCHHPALPLCEIVALWEDGHKESFTEILIRFESKYAFPDVKWKQHPSIPLQRRELPQQIQCSSVHYGQVGIEEIYVMYKGTKYIYTPVRIEGQFAQQQEDIVWIGPIRSTVDSPLRRKDKDVVIYERDIARFVSTRV